MFGNLKLKSKMIGSGSVPLLLFTLIFILIHMGINSLLESSRWVDHTYKVIQNALIIGGNAVDMETGARGFLLSGKDTFLMPYTEGEKHFYENIKTLKKTVSDNPEQVNRLKEIENLIREWQNEVMNKAIGLRREIGDAESMNDMAGQVEKTEGKRYFDRFREQIAMFIDTEEKLITKRKKEAADAYAEAKNGFQALLDMENFAHTEERRMREGNDRPLKEREIGIFHIEALGKANAWVEHSHKVIQTALKIMASATDTETAMRGYLLVGKEEFLNPYDKGRSRFFQMMSELKLTVSDNPEQLALLNRAENIFSEWIENVTEPNIKQRRKAGHVKTMGEMAELVQKGEGKIYFDKFRSLIDEFISEEEKLMEIRSRANTDMTKKMKFIIIAGGIFVILLALCISWIIAVRIVRPISNVVERLKDIAEGEGDLTMRLEIENRDEIGELAKWFNLFVEKLQGIIRDVTGNTEKLAVASGDLRDVSEKLARSAGEMTSRSTDVSAGTEEMSVNISNMASATEEMSTNAQNVSVTSEQMSHNMDSVASAIEEMSVSIRDIAGNAGEGAKISAKAREMTLTATNAMNALGKAAGEIGEVTEAIRRIAEQTNLLALNATIEAASAGDAGRGFAVVANEIKELAGQSARAAENIAKQIGGVQKNTENSVGIITDISAIISRLNEAVSMISSSVEQVAGASEDISANVSQAGTGVNNIAGSIAEVAKGSNDMAMNAGEAAKAANDVAANIRNVSDAAKDTDNYARQVSRSANDMSQMAENLRNLMGQFRVGTPVKNIRTDGQGEA